MLSSCQPLEIPGNVIQSCSLKNHSARNSPGQQRQLDRFVVRRSRQSTQNTNNKYANRPAPTSYPLIPFYLLPTSLFYHPPLFYIFAIHRSKSLRSLSPCACAWFSSTPRLPVASYKNSFSMTEWRIRLEGSGQSSGTPFKDVCPRSALLLPLYLCPLCGKVKHRTVFPPPQSYYISSEMMRNPLMLRMESDTVFIGFFYILLSVR